MSDLNKAMADLQRSIMLPLGLTFLLTAIIAACHAVPGPFPNVFAWTNGDAASASAGFGAVSAIFLGLHQFSTQRDADASKFSLDMAMGGVRQAFAVIQGDVPSRNMAWVNGARLLLRAQKNALRISESSHRDAWDLFHEEWRIRFLGLLRAGPEYFSGIGPWAEQTNKIVVDEQFADRIAHEAFNETSMKAPNVSATSYGEKLVHEHIIKVIYDFTEYSADWIDPITNRAGFGDEISNPLFQRNLTGLWAYLELRRKFILSMGRATPKRNDPTLDT